MMGKMSHIANHYQEKTIGGVFRVSSRTDIGLAGLANGSEQICVVSVEY